MLGNINYPVKVRLVISLKNGEKFAFSCSLPEAEKQLVAKLYDLATKVVEQNDPRQLTIPARFPNRITLQGGKVIETKDGVIWKEVVESRPRNPECKTKADCDAYGYHCGTQKCPFPDTACADRESGIRARVESDLARAKVETKRGRGRPKKDPAGVAGKKKAAQQRAEESEEIENCKHFPKHCDSAVFCPRNGTDCYRRGSGREQNRLDEKAAIIETAEKSPKHSGEICKAKIVECETVCTSANCVFYQQSFIKWSACQGELFPDRCTNCPKPECLLRDPAPHRLCKIENSMCPDCDNPYCSYSIYGGYEEVEVVEGSRVREKEPAKQGNDAASENNVVSINSVHGRCKQGVTVSCLDECQDVDCKYQHETPYCKTGFPDLCNTTCRNDQCVFYRWEK